MAWIITKYLLTAGIVILVSELAKRSDKLGGLVAALPLVTDAGLALFGEPEHGEDLQSCLVHVLVRASYTADVYRVPVAAT